MKAPQPKKINHTLLKHGDTRMDPFFWLNDKQNPEVLQYLHQENSYCDYIMQDTEELQEQLYEEMKARYKEDDASLPYYFNEYWYIIRYETGKEYPIYCRKYKSMDADEEILLDVNTIAEGQEYTDVGSGAVSPNNKLAAYSADFIGRRIYTLHFKDLVTGELLPDAIPNTTGKTLWASDNKHVFYVRKDESLRAFQVFRHRLGTEASEDILVFHEEDETYDVSIYKTKSQKYLFIASSSTNSDEHRYIPADHVEAQWKIIQPREEDLEYAVEHFEDEFYIITNADEATNFKIVTVKVDQPQIENWVDLIPHRENILLEGFEIFQNYLVLEEREEGLLQIKIIDNKTSEHHYLEFNDPTYTAFIELNLEFETSLLRFGYTSLLQPSATFEYNMETRTTTLLKEQEVLGEGFTKADYRSERIWAVSGDGNSRIPISLVYHKNTRRSSETPLLLYGYGSYGHTVDASFSNVRLSLLNRGFVYAIAHIRGGEYLGRHWYEEGRMLQKKNTFYDFIDAAKHLVQKNYTSSPHMYAMGGSAGGLLVGAVINMESKLFNGIVAQLPFVDVVTTMLDETIPLTTGEYDEWGNPEDEEYYHYMKSYSPYDNVQATDYPHMLITTGLHDSQVQYWEPAKWTAKLRELKTDKNLLLLKTDMKSGHGGASGRFESLKEDALELAFLLKLENFKK